MRKLRVYGAGSFYLNSACLKVLVPVKIFQFQDMLNESERYQDAANGLFLIISRASLLKTSKKELAMRKMQPPLITTRDAFRCSTTSASVFTEKPLEVDAIFQATWHAAGNISYSHEVQDRLTRVLNFAFEESNF